MGCVCGLRTMLWSFGLQFLVYCAQTPWADPSSLQCGSNGLQFTLPSLFQDAAFVLTVLDDVSRSHYFHNDTSCGTWIAQKQDGSVIIGSSFDGCYVSREGKFYVMTISLEEVLIDGSVQSHIQKLECPVLPEPMAENWTVDHPGIELFIPDDKPEDFGLRPLEVLQMQGDLNSHISAMAWLRGSVAVMLMLVLILAIMRLWKSHKDGRNGTDSVKA